MSGTPTKAQMAALKWLAEHGGDGVFAGRGGTLLAQGEIAPVMRGTWNRLTALDLTEFEGRRIRLTDAGKAAVTA